MAEVQAARATQRRMARPRVLGGLKGHPEIRKK